MGLGVRALSRELGISHVAILKAEKTGRIQRETDGSFDLERCRKAMVANSNPEKQRQARSQQKPPRNLVEPPEPQTDISDCPPDELVKPPAESISEALRRQAWVKLRKDELDLSQRSGEFVRVAEVRAAVAGMITAARSKFLVIGAELRDHLAQTSDPIECQKLVDGKILQALQELSEYRPASPEQQTKKEKRTNKCSN